MNVSRCGLPFFLGMVYLVWKVLQYASDHFSNDAVKIASIKKLHVHYSPQILMSMTMTQQLFLQHEQVLV